MISALSLLTSLGKACLVVFLLLLARGLAWLFNLLVLAPPFDPLRTLPGPDTTVLGSHFNDVMECVDTMDGCGANY
jgi:hypothetical protein